MTDADIEKIYADGAATSNHLGGLKALFKAGVLYQQQMHQPKVDLVPDSTLAVAVKAEKTAKRKAKPKVVTKGKKK